MCFSSYTYAPVLSTNIHLLPEEGIFILSFLWYNQIASFVILALWPLGKIVTETHGF